MIESFLGHKPQIASSAFVHTSATLIGQVSVGERASIWPGVVLRGDMGAISIGDETSIQDGSIGHITENFSSTRIGKRVTVGHRVILHGCIVEDECLIGMGSILLDNCHIGKGSLIAAGTLVTVGSIIPANSVVMGSPGKVVRQIRPQDREMIESGWKLYVDYGQKYKQA